MLVTLLLLPKKKSFYVTFFLLHYFTDNQKKARYNIRNRVTFYKKNLAKHLLIQKKYLPLHPQSRNKPFVYRLGRKIFILERGVRLPHGLQLKK